MEVSIETLKKRLQKISVGRKPDRFHSAVYKMFRKASVLIPVFFENGIPHVLLILRSAKLENAPDTVAFPGGVIDKSDSDEIETALREAQEEIGLLPSQVEIVCFPPRYVMAPNFIVTPVIGLIPESFTPILNHEEVDMTFHLPLARFLKTDYTLMWLKPFGVSHNTLFFKDMVHDREVVTWGYNSLMCLLIATAVYDKQKIRNFKKGSTEVNLETMLETLQRFLDHVVALIFKANL